MGFERRNERDMVGEGEPWRSPGGLAVLVGYGGSIRIAGWAWAGVCVGGSGGQELSWAR